MDDFDGQVPLVTGAAQELRRSIAALAAHRQSGAPVDFNFNQALFVADSWVIPRGTKNKGAALDFIAFSLQAAPQAEFSKAIPYGPVNRKALALLDKQRLAFLPSSPENFPKGVFQDFDWWAQNGQKAGERFNGWIIS